MHISDCYPGKLRGVCGRCGACACPTHSPSVPRNTCYPLCGGCGSKLDIAIISNEFDAAWWMDTSGLRKYSDP